MWWAILCTASVHNYKVRAQRKIKKPTHRSVEKILPSSDLCMNSTTNFHIIPVTLLNDKRKVKRKKKRLHICHKWGRAGAKWKSAFFLRIWSLDVRNILFVYASFKKLTTMSLTHIPSKQSFSKEQASMNHCKSVASQALRLFLNSLWQLFARILPTNSS